MSKIKLFLEAAIVTIVVLALVLPSSAIITNSATVKNEKNTVEFENSEKISREIGKINGIPKKESSGSNILISFGEGNDIHPGITQDSAGNIVVAFSQEMGILETRLGWSFSADGEIWEGVELTDPALDIYHDIAWVDGDYFTGLFGVFCDLVENQYGFYTIIDIFDTGTWNFYSWIGEEQDLTYAAISDNGWLEGQYHDHDGPVNMYINYFGEMGYDIESCPIQMITGFDETGEIEGGESTIDGQRDLVSAPAYDPDMSNEYMKTHHTWYCYDETDQTNKIVWKKIIPVEGDTDSTDIEYTPYQQHLGEGTNPAIAHYGDNVAVVYMNGGNIQCTYSGDDGGSWNSMTIGPGSYPDICAVGSKFQCAYVDGGDLFVVESEDGGQTWGSPIQVNDVDGSVVAEENTVDIHPAGVVWTDNRDNDFNIYYATVGNAPSQPTTPDGPTSGKPNRALTYTTSSTDPNGDDVSYGWDWNGDDTVDEWTDFYPSGEVVSTTHKFTSSYTGNIKVKAKDTNDDESPWSDPLSVSIPKNKATNLFPLLQRFLEQHPNLFPILKYLLGL